MPNEETAHYAEGMRSDPSILRENSSKSHVVIEIIHIPKVLRSADAVGFRAAEGDCAGVLLLEEAAGSSTGVNQLTSTPRELATL